MAWIRGPGRRPLRKVGPTAIRQRINGFSLPNGCWLGRVRNPSFVFLGGSCPHQPGAGSESSRFTSLSSVFPENGAKKVAAKVASDDGLRHCVVDCLSKRWSTQRVCLAVEAVSLGKRRSGDRPALSG